jgi:hypothetical protein
MVVGVERLTASSYRRPGLKSNLATVKPGSGRLLARANCSLTGSIACHELKTCAATVPSQAFKILIVKPIAVSHFNCVRPTLGQLAEKAVQHFNEFAAMLVIV